MFFTIDKIVALLVAYKYAIIFPIAILEGPIISILTGFLASTRVISLYPAFLILILGDLVGDSLYYAIGRFGGIRFIKRWGHFFGVYDGELIKFENYFKNHDARILLVGKTQPIGSLTLVTAGFVRMPFRRFILITGLGTVVKTAILLAIGYYFGRAYISMEGYITKVAVIFSLILVCGVIVYFMHKRKKRK